ncbi:peptidyl-glycine alpha-amidating monooxygenase A-like [Amphiura filiformis]|uniref:peptidyl-glycine alpha-amidating monooxygenase A-like n=1 Tax=Amphiura filiformis TaxID=82378 RepID=UPI003B223504
MKSQSQRTVYIVYHVLIVLLSIILSCNSKAFDWGNIRQRYGDRDNEVFEQDVRMPGVIPKSDDQYMCTSVQMPRQDAYIVNFEPHATMKKAHHMLLYGCFDIVSSPGEAYSCMGMGVCKGGQSSILFAWARDAPAPSIPEGVGFHVGGDSRINYVTLQIHYGHKDAFAGKTHISIHKLHTLLMMLYSRIHD